MAATARCFRLLMLEFILLGTQSGCTRGHASGAALPRVKPNRLQHFEYDSISFHCGGATQLRLLRNAEEVDPPCAIKATWTGSSCTIAEAYTADSGEYWCGTEGGGRRNAVNITVTPGSVILDSPVHPVMEGHRVTLRCRDNSTSTNLAFFYNDDVLMASGAAEEITITNVSRVNEGLYKCKIPDVGTSPGSWLVVRETLSENLDSSHDRPPLLWIVVTILTVAVALLLAGFLSFRKHRASSKTSTAASQSAEDLQRASADEAADDLTSVTYAAVFTKRRKDEDAADAGDTSSLCSKSNHSRQSEDDESRQPVYSTSAVGETRRARRSGSSSCTAGGATSPAEQDAIYSALRKATKSSDT